MAYDEELADRIRDLIGGEPDVSEKRMLPFEMRDRAMTGWLHVDAEGLSSARQLEPWVARGVAYARSLPAKP